MKNTLLMLVVLAAGVSGAAEKQVKHQVKALSIQVPESWERSQEDGTEKFDAPTGGTFFLLDVGQVQTAGMKADVCLDKILAGVGPDGWKKIQVASQPAARRVSVDATEDGKDKVESIHYVGCNGKTTWSLIFSMNQLKKEELEPVLSKVVQSISYTKGK
ncbi:hypothetical protein [Stigmatella aurantiaca]|uniref:Conserved uncharacterized protein n=1 Tax=Stigmatella aurantiaca (strain DW4/3-1) TaxID=378806 RepID=Q08SN0_STIAD|nr:hypothetical protein [Stigmatella aurantiaca]ADO72526.1 conserved uncharacterized protein [Stigmatella aurantiaca DW4/3-1]EAU63485.1 hypothetical protein STIAU_7001 [Stigmatella aurantiaca DW4/3-1]